MSKITYGTIKRLKESKEIEVRVYDSEDAYKNDNYYVAEVLDSGVNVDDYCEGVVDKFENPYYVELVDSTGKVVGHTSGVDEEGNFLTEEVKKNPTEEYWDATEIERDLFVSLLRFDFGYDYKGNNYIITIDNNEAERFQADNDEEAREIYKKWKEAKDNGSVEYDFNNNYKKIVEAKAADYEEEDEEVEDTELWVNGKIYWKGDGKRVDYNLLLDVADQATEEDGVPYDHEDVEVVKVEESLKEAEAEKRNDVDIEELARQIMSFSELFDELSQDDTDVFAGTQDSYAVEVFEQNLYDTLLYSGLFQIEDFAQEMKSPSLDGKKLDELYSGIRDIIEDGKGFETVKDIENYIRSIVEDNGNKLKEAVNPNMGYIDFLKQSLGDTYKEEETDKYLIVRGMKDGKPIGALWYGKASKPQIYSTFSSEEQREEYIKRFLNNKASDEEAKAKRREEQRLTKDHNFKVGDIFYTSWGYDQTNIDFYEVVKVRGSRLDLRELRKETVGQSGTYDEVKPIPGDYASDKIITISARADGTVTRMSSFEYPSLWNGKPKYETNSYYGH